MDRVVVIVSGGLDSTVLLYDLLYSAKGTPKDVSSVVSFNYGQRHKKELDYAQATCARLGLKHHVIDLWSSGLTEALQVPGGTSLLESTGVEVPDGHYAEDTMKATVVPNRNMIMLSIAGAIAVAEGAVAVATGVHGGDHFIYPDCRTGFVGAASLALYLGNEGFGNLWRAPILAPFIHKTKADIATRAIELGIPFVQTWSCYKGGDKHCGRCGTCVERLEAIDIAISRVGGFDGTLYEDPDFWRTVTQNDVR